jgi:hypothetical protein
MTRLHAQPSDRVRGRLHDRSLDWVEIGEDRFRARREGFAAKFLVENIYVESAALGCQPNRKPANVNDFRR